MTRVTFRDAMTGVRVQSRPMTEDDAASYVAAVLRSGAAEWVRVEPVGEGS